MTGRTSDPYHAANGLNGTSPTGSTFSDRNPHPSLSPSIEPDRKHDPAILEQVSAAGRKRKSVGSSSRGVANLTAEQLAKKRANDREAQRAIRKRTKQQIEALEQRVKELTSQQPYQDLQSALRQKQAVQAENEEIRRRLSSVMALIQPLVRTSGSITSSEGASMPNGSGADVRQWPAPDLPSPISHPDLSGGGSHASSNAVADSSLRNSLSSLDSTGAANGNFNESPRSSSNPSNAAYGARQNTWRGNVPPHSHPDQNYATSNNAFDYQRHMLTHGLDFSGNGERLGLNFLLDSSQSVPKINDFRQTSPSGNLPLPYRQMQPNPVFSDPNSPPYAIPVRNIEPTCPLDSILLDFLRTRQREAAEGASGRQLVGPPYPSVSSLLNPASSAYSHPLSKVFTDILSKFPDISSLPEQVAVLYVMFLVMRWQIYPTQENYDRLPEWVTPRASQLITPHPAWIDYLPWPRMRDRMIASYQDYDFSNWFIPYTTTLSVNWPYEATDTLLSTPDSDELIINPVFERHLRNLNNWTLGPAFARAYPGLVDTVRIKPDMPDQGASAISGRSVTIASMGQSHGSLE